MKLEDDMGGCILNKVKFTVYVDGKVKPVNPQLLDQSITAVMTGFNY